MRRPQDITKEIDFVSLTNLNSDCQRLFHGRGHAYEGFEFINIDWLSPVILITLYKSAEDAWLSELVDLLIANVDFFQSIQVQHRYEKGGPIECLCGEPVSEAIVSEQGLKFHIQLGKSQNTGLFLDMVNGRDWVRQHAKDKAVLNLFSYTCAFSVAAMAGGASRVVNIDNNRSVLNKGRDNHKLNLTDFRDVRFEKLDIFKSYNRIKKYGPYDLLICDPPTFQAGSVDIERDYRKIITRIPQWMNPGSEIMLCLNSPDLTDVFIHNVVEEFCPQCQFVKEIKPPLVFKEAMKGKGLKVLLFSYLPIG